MRVQLMWVVMLREHKDEPFKPWTGGRLRPTVYSTKKDAEEDLYAAQQIHGTRNAYVQKVGAIS